MSKPRKDRIREERIRNEAVVDAYGPEEKVMGWYYYLENKLRFPFQAKCIASKVVSPLRKGETVEVRRFIAKDRCDTGHFDHITCLKLLPTCGDFCIVYSDLDVLPSTNNEVPVFSLLNRGGGTRSEPPLQPNAGHLRLSDHAELA